jgi:diguanylate cyclase (GGDEF)-like protein/PAS domain S-box-containing protein
MLVQRSLEPLIVHADGIIVTASPAATSLLGWSLDQILGKEIYGFAAPESVARAHERRVSAVAGGWPLPERLRLRTATGATLEVELASCPVMWNGSVASQITLRPVRPPDDAPIELDEDDELLAEVTAGLDGGEFEVWYQPVVRPGNGTMVKVEALVRWRHPERGLLLPAAFLEAVERSPLIVALDDHVLRTASRQVAAWRAGPAPRLELAVNLSVRDLVDDTLADRVGDALAASGLPAHALWLEVTETALATEPDAAILALQALRGLGVRLSLDDFGTGFAHLVQLRRFPVQAVKIDRGFVAGMSTDPSDAAIVRSVIGLGRELGLTVVAEGVETEAERLALVELRCDLAQGYLFGRPVPAADLPLAAAARAGLVPHEDLRSCATERVEALCSCAVMDTAPEAGFDEVAALASRLCDAPIAIVCLVDEDRQWFKARVGIDIGETPPAWGFCRLVVDTRACLVVPDALEDPRFADNPFVLADPHIRSYAGVPLVLSDGHAVGTLCVIDRQPRVFADRQLEDLASLARQVTTQLELRRTANGLHETRRSLEQARAGLDDQERYLRAVVDSSRDIICRITPEGVVEMASDGMRHLLGVDPGTYIGRSAMDLVHEDDLALALTTLASTAASLGKAEPIRLRALHASGSFVPVEVVANTIEEHDGQRRIVVTISDMRSGHPAPTSGADGGVTPSDEVGLLRAIIETQRLVNAQADNLDEVMSIIVGRTQDLTGASGAVVELCEGDDMVQRAVAGDLADHLGLRLPMAASLSGMCVMGGQALVCEDAETDPRVDRDACRRMGIRSMVVVPLTPGGDTCVGVLKAVSREPNAFASSVRQTLEMMAEFLGTSIRNAAEFEHRAHQATHDALTGLPNRVLFTDRLEGALARYQRSGVPVALMFIDLDGFKAVNDRLGHHAGDIVLVTVAQRLSARLRVGDTVARLGGDEYVLLCEGLHEFSVAALAARIGANIERPIRVEAASIQVRASVGFAIAQPTDTAKTLLARADVAMYFEKQRDPAPSQPGVALTSA